MKPMIWHPEEKDKKVNEYLAQINHAPYPTILAIGFILFLFLTLFMLLAAF
jgi:hypothetical protein